MLASKLICYSSSHPPAFGFLASSQPDNITLNSAIKRTDQSLSDFQTSIHAATHATLDTEQLIFHTRMALADTIASFQGSNGGVIAASEVHETIAKIQDILDNAISK